MKRRIIIISVIVASILTIGALATTFYLTLPKNLEQIAPEKINTAEKIRTLTGSQAISATKSSHVGKLKNPYDAIIIVYDNQATIWISKYPTKETARQETERMAKAMRHFGKGFEKWEKIKVNGVSVFRTYPKGDAHYFWQYKMMMIYIAPGMLTEEQVKDLIKEINLRTRLYLVLK